MCVWSGLSTHSSSAATETTGESLNVNGALSMGHGMGGMASTLSRPIAELSTFCLTPPGDFPTRKGRCLCVCIVVNDVV